MIRITKSRRGDRIKFVDLIFEDYPHPNSLAGYILLRNAFFFRTHQFKEMNKWLDFRHKFLNKILRKEKILKCHYCGKPNLEIGYREPHLLYRNTSNKNIATIDHIVPISGGGDKYDEKNMVVSCRKCNNRKADTPYKDFIEKTKKTKL